MSPEILVLRALLRLARRRTPPTLAQIVDRVDATEAEIQRALARLARAGLVQRTAGGLQLSLAGLAVAVATTAPVAQSRRSRQPLVMRLGVPHTQRPNRRDAA
jgi:DNA-binding IclR family transcriptional regulator